MVAEIEINTIVIVILTAICSSFMMQKYFVFIQQHKEKREVDDQSTPPSAYSQLFTSPAFDINDPYAILVGVGPGDTTLLTVAALKVLSEAELVLCDRLVSAEILALLGEINPGCEIRKASKCKKRSNSSIVQNQLNDWIAEGLRKGLKVCRLKGGDPFLFGRGMEEVESVLKIGYKIKVVPGISSGFSAPLAAGISVTKRNAANKILVATAHGQFDTYPDMPTFRSDCTLVFLMGISRLELIMKELLEKGFPESTTVCIVERATTAQQRQVSGNIGNIAEFARKTGIKPPATIVIGRVCNNQELIETYKTSYRNGGVIFSPI